MPVIGMSQGSKIGVRAGLNYAWFSGPLEVNEDYSKSNGFHFGLNYSYYFNDYLGLRLELLYNQKGTKQSYLGDTYAILRRGGERIYDFGKTDYQLDISNAYLSIPVMISVQLSRKIEVFGGVNVDFLIGPTGRGRVDYASIDNPGRIEYIRSFEYNYNSDLAGQASSLSGATTAQIVDGTRLDVPRIIGAYYFLNEAEKDGNRFRKTDLSLEAGLNYFINTGFFVGASFSYGLIDPTRRELDISLGELNNDNSFIFRDDKDHQLSLQFSIGFRF